LFDKGYRKKCGGEVNLPEGDAILTAVRDMRQDTTGVYQLLLSIFVPAFVTRAIMIRGIKEGKSWSDMVSVSDEAFVVVFVLNFWNTLVTGITKKITAEDWPNGIVEHKFEIHKKESDKKGSEEECDKKDDEKWPLNDAVWSDWGKGKKWKHYTGWHPAGIECYIKSKAQIKTARIDTTTNVAFDAVMRSKFIATMSEKDQAKLARGTSSLVRETTTTSDEPSSALNESLGEFV
jgi:hypothetical protein